MFRGRANISKLQDRYDVLEAKFKALESVFNSSFKEIDFLRIQNKELHDRLISYATQAFNNFVALKAHDEPAEAPMHITPSGILESMEALSDEEQIQKNAARKQIQGLMGAI